MHAILSGSMALPMGLVDLPSLTKRLTYKTYGLGEVEATEVEAYRVDGDFIHVPRQFGIGYCLANGIEYDDRTSPGVEINFNRLPVPREYQVGPIEELTANFDSYYDFIFRARTGFGKSVSSLLVAASLGRSTLVVVDQENLLEQWEGALLEHFGMPPEEVGRVQGPVLRYKGMAVTIAMVHTLAQREFPQDFYDYFGFVILDEVHVMGAPTFSRPLMALNAAYRLGISATPKRRDGLQKALDDNLGKVRVYVSDEHKRSSVYIATHESVYSWYANSSPKMGRYITEIADDASRNLLVAESAVMLYDSGRDTLVLSDRTEHLQDLMNLCYYSGVPEEDLGMFTGEYNVYAYVKQTTPPRRPNGCDRGVEYTPVELKSISKKTPKAVRQKVKESAKLMFATYGMFAKGMDVPRLAGGVDATPRSRAEQVHGRILREKEGKRKSIWVTVADTLNYRSVHQLAERIADYTINNAELYVLYEDGTVESCPKETLVPNLRQRSRLLKSMRIERDSDGLNMLPYQSMRMLPDLQTEAPTRRTIPLRENSRVACSSPVPSGKSHTMTPKAPTVSKATPSRRLLRR